MKCLAGRLLAISSMVLIPCYFTLACTYALSEMLSIGNGLLNFWSFHGFWGHFAFAMHMCEIAAACWKTNHLSLKLHIERTLLIESRSHAADVIWSRNAPAKQVKYTSNSFFSLNFIPKFPPFLVNYMMTYATKKCILQTIRAGKISVIILRGNDLTSHNQRYNILLH